MRSRSISFNIWGVGGGSPWADRSWAKPRTEPIGSRSSLLNVSRIQSGAAAPHSGTQARHGESVRVFGGREMTSGETT